MTSPCASPAVPAGCTPSGLTDPRVLDNFTRRYNAAVHQSANPPAHPNNGDIGLPDYCASYSKGIKQAGEGLVDVTEYQQFLAACNGSGNFSDFENVSVPNANKLNGPLGSFVRAFVGADDSNFAIPTTSAPWAPTVPAPWSISSPDYATELVELYWASLLRDTPFSAYASDPVAIAAAKELSGLASYHGPRDANGHVTPQLLFRGHYKGEKQGPYTSQLLLLATNMGALPIVQRYVSYQPGVDYMTDLATWYAVQQGKFTGYTDSKDPVLRYLYNGRAFAAWTHVDELYQAYFTAYLVLNNLAAAVPSFWNPGRPYNAAKSQKPFGTFAGPDIAAVLAQVAKYALSAVWYQKWVVHLRHRPEAAGGLVHLIKQESKGFSATPDNIIFDSNALAASHAKYGSYLLSQAFPEGSPTHPAYPTGHGTVGGACITILKFFFNGDATFTGAVMPNQDGTALEPWTGQPGTGHVPAVGGINGLTVNGELAKLAHNITFGHGIHGGIHWRSDSDASMELGESVALSFLEDLKCTYAEQFSVTIKKLDGSSHTITNV